MKNKKIREAWNKVEPDQAADERMQKAILQENQTRKMKWRVFVPLALSFALVVLIAIPILNDNQTAPQLPVEVANSEENVASIESEVEEPKMLTFDLEKSSPDIQIKYADEVMDGGSEASLVYLSEEELMAETYNGNQLAAFHGIIKAIHNLEIIYKHRTDHIAVVEVEIIEDLRTNLEPGTVVTVWMPGHIRDGGGTNTVMDTAGTLKVGAEAIMMPIHYDEKSFYTETGGETVHLDEIAQYRIGDGIRWLFVETPEGIVFAEHAYPSFLGAKTLEDVADIIRNY